MWNLQNTPFVEWLGYLDNLHDNDFEEFKRWVYRQRNLSYKWLEEMGLNYKDFSIADDDGLIIWYPDTENEPKKGKKITADKYLYENYLKQKHSRLLAASRVFLNNLKNEEKYYEQNFQLYLQKLKEQIKALLNHTNCKSKFLKKLFSSYSQAIDSIPQKNLTQDSFNLKDLPSKKPDQILKELYTGLRNSPPLIDCTEKEFINAFTGKSVKEGIKWLAKTKKGDPNIHLIIFLLDCLYNKSLLSLTEADLESNSKILYTFKRPTGLFFKRNDIKSSKWRFRDRMKQGLSNETTHTHTRIKLLIASL